MVLEAAKCPNCGGNIEVDSKKSFFNCSYCGSSISVKDAIEAYREEQKKEHRLGIADDCFERGIIDEAKEIYEEICKRYPNDYRGWLGVIKCNPITSDFLNRMDDTYRKALAFAPKEMKKEIEEDYQKRKKTISKYINLEDMYGQIKTQKKDSDSLKESIVQQEGAIKELNKEIENIETTMIPNSKKIIKSNKNVAVLLTVIGTVVALAGIMLCRLGDGLIGACIMVLIMAVLFYIEGYILSKEAKESKALLDKLVEQISQKNKEKENAEFKLSETKKTLENEEKKKEELNICIQKIKEELGIN